MDKKIFRPSPFFWIFPVILLLVYIVIIISIYAIPFTDFTPPNPLDPGNVLPFLFFWIVALATIWITPMIYTGNLYIELSKTGITYNGVGFCFYTPWQNVAALGQQPMLFRRSIKTLVLKEKLPIGKMTLEEAKLYNQPIFTKRWRHWPVRTRVWDAYGLYYPLMIRKKDWQSGEFEETMRAFRIAAGELSAMDAPQELIHHDPPAAIQQNNQTINQTIKGIPATILGPIAGLFARQLFPQLPDWLWIIIGIIVIQVTFSFIMGLIARKRKKATDPVMEPAKLDITNQL